MRNKIDYHSFLARLLELLLTVVGITVQAEVQIMSKSPRVDILLLRRKSKFWTKKQQRLLPDGIRDSHASHILIDFKATESLSARVLQKVAAYDLFYKQSQKLPPESVLTVLLSAKQPQAKKRNRLGFVPTDQPGIYRNENLLAQHVVLISLNELPDTNYNAFVKLFASKTRSREAALRVLHAIGFRALPHSVSRFIAGLILYWSGTEGDTMTQPKVTPDEVMGIGKEWYDVFLSILPPEERLAGLSPEEVLSQFKPEERLAGLSPEEVLSQFKPEERLAGLSSEEIEAYLERLEPEQTEPNS